MNVIKITAQDRGDGREPFYEAGTELMAVSITEWDGGLLYAWLP